MEHVDIYKTPAMKPPEGVKPDLSSPSPVYGVLIAVVVLCLAVSILAVILRLFVKAVIARKVQFEDYGLIISAACILPFGIQSIANGRHGQGKHQWDISIADGLYLREKENIVQCLYGAVIFPAKLCVLMQMQRIFCGPQRDSVFWCIQFLIWSNFLFYFAVTVSLIAACVPRSALSNPLVHGRCISSNGVILTSSIINVISDVLILLVPFYAVWKLQMPLTKKMVIFAVFSSGLLACISSILRLAYGVRLVETEDQTIPMNSVDIWAHVEFATVILAAAIPVVPRLVRWLRDGSRGSRPTPVAYSSGQRDKPSYPSRGKSSRYLGKNSDHLELTDQSSQISVTRVMPAPGDSEFDADNVSRDAIDSGTAGHGREMPSGILRTVNVDVEREGSITTNQ